MHAVGSVIDIRGSRFVVCGYRPFDKDGTVDVGYLLVPYPLGFVSLDSFSLVTADTDYPVVYEGFRNEDAERYDGLLEQTRTLGQETAFEDVLAVVDEARAEIAAELFVPAEEGE